MTLFTGLWFKIAGIALVTFGFFGGHSIASSWVGSIASTHKAQASSLYLFFYYVGSSVSGTVGGLFYTRFGWKGVVGMITVYMAIGLVLSTGLKRLYSNGMTRYTINPCSNDCKRMP